MKIIGFTSHIGNNHDSSAALLVDGKIIQAEAVERVTRKKHDSSFAQPVIKEIFFFFLLKSANIDYYVSGAPETSFRTALKSYIDGIRFVTVPDLLNWVFLNIVYMIKTIPVLISTKRTTYKESGFPEKKLLFVPHHLAHAETAYTFSNMNKCLVIAWDGYGPDQRGYTWCAGIHIGSDGQLKHSEQINIWNSVGLYYGAVTLVLGFKLNDGEGKTMGFASYGKSSPAVKKMREFFPSFTNGKWKTRSNWMEICGVSRLPFFKMTPSYGKLMDMVKTYGEEQVAFAAQEIFEEVCESYVKYLVKKYKISDVAVAGGLFLNVKFNMRILKNKTVNSLFVYPNPGDGGIAVGAAVAAYKELGRKKSVEVMESASLGCEYSNSEIEKAYVKFKKVLKIEKLGKNTSRIAAEKISQGKVIGWFQGRSEWGPRALGNRSVLADPRHEETKERINTHLKKRDWFMPFAPAILKEHVAEFLENGYGTPFMTLADDVKKGKRSKIAAAIHIDGTARFQTVDKKVNPIYWDLIDEFKKITGVPVILNTSFNKHGLPIVHTPTDALEHLEWGCLDELIIGDYLFTRRDEKH